MLRYGMMQVQSSGSGGETMFQNLINIVAAPQSAFDSLKEKRSALFPLLLLVLITGLTQFLYFTNVDPDFLIDQLIEQMSGLPIPEAELREGLEQSSPADGRIQSAISAAIFVPIMMALYAAYMSMTSKFTGDEIGFKRWFSLVAWTSVPVVFSALAGILVVLMSSDGMIALTDLKPFSLNNLIFHTTGSFRSLLSALDITQIWSAVLMILGYKNWTGKSGIGSGIVVLLPYILIYGIWALIIIL
jgi:hypothetical protein